MRVEAWHQALEEVLIERAIERGSRTAGLGWLRGRCFEALPAHGGLGLALRVVTRLPWEDIH